MIKGRGEILTDTFIWYRLKDADPPKPAQECEHVSKGKAGDGIIYFDDKGKRVKLDVEANPYEVGIDGRRACKRSGRRCLMWTE